MIIKHIDWVPAEVPETQQLTTILIQAYYSVDIVTRFWQASGTVERTIDRVKLKNIMSKQASQSVRWDFTVSQLQLRHPVSNALLKGQFGNFRNDTGECLGTTSEQYGLIQNRTLLDAAHSALDKRGLGGFSEKILAAGQFGERFYAEFTFANKQLASRVGDVFGYKLTLKNSFDRSIRAAFSLGFLRLTCLNGASTLEKEFSVTRKHSANVTVDFLGDAIDKALTNGQSALRVYDDMADTVVTDEQGINALNQLVLANVLSGSLRESIKTLWLAPRRQEDKARNLYSLYNAVTEHLTHQVSGQRYEYADKVNNNVLLRLVNAARSKDKLARLILPVPQPEVIVSVDPVAVADATQAGIIEAEVVG